VSEDRDLEKVLVRWLEKLWRDFLHFLERRTRVTLSIEGNPMSDYQLTEGYSVQVTITVTDTVTGAAVTPDADSVTASSSNPSDSVVVDPSQTFLTLTAGDTAATDQTLTVNAAVGGVASTPGTGTYDVVAPPANPTAVTLSFGTETPPAS